MIITIPNIGPGFSFLKAWKLARSSKGEGGSFVRCIIFCGVLFVGAFHIKLVHIYPHPPEMPSSIFDDSFLVSMK